MCLSFLWFSGCGRRKSAGEVVEAGEEHHADKHGHVVARAHRGVGKQAQTQRLGSAVSDQVACGDVRREAHGLSHAALAAAEREVFVKEEAQNTCQHVVGRRGHPVRAPSNVIQAEHDRRADERVDHCRQAGISITLHQRAHAIASKLRLPIIELRLDPGSGDAPLSRDRSCRYTPPPRRWPAAAARRWPRWTRQGSTSRRRYGR